MIWEVDENLDQMVDWHEFQLMFERNTTDQTGLEPFELFNIVQFMTYDEDFKGHITEDDTMSTLFARHGRDNLEEQMTKLFGDQLKSAGGEVSRRVKRLAKSASCLMHLYAISHPRPSTLLTTQQSDSYRALLLRLLLQGILTLDQYLKAVSVRQVKESKIEYTVVTGSMSKSVNHKIK